MVITDLKKALGLISTAIKTNSQYTATLIEIVIGDYVDRALPIIVSSIDVKGNVTAIIASSNSINSLRLLNSNKVYKNNEYLGQYSSISINVDVNFTSYQLPPINSVDDLNNLGGINGMVADVFVGSSYVKYIYDGVSGTWGVLPISTPLLPDVRFAPLYVSGSPAISTLTINTGTSQNIAIPAHNGSLRLTWNGNGLFAYRFGTSGAVVALTTDSPTNAGLQRVAPVPSGMAYIAVYGIGSGSVVIEGGGTSSFVPTYISGSPSVAKIVINSAISQSVAIPTNDGLLRTRWNGSGRFSYIFGNSSIVASANNTMVMAGSEVLIPVPSGMTHFAVYGIGSGDVTIEGGA